MSNFFSFVFQICLIGMRIYGKKVNNQMWKKGKKLIEFHFENDVAVTDEIVD